MDFEHNHVFEEVLDTGVRIYFKCDCGARRSELKSNIYYDPVDELWLRTGVWSK